MSSNLLNVQMKRNRKSTESTGRSWGSVTYQKRCEMVAPSTMAASLTSSGMATASRQDEQEGKREVAPRLEDDHGHQRQRES